MKEDGRPDIAPQHGVLLLGASGFFGPALASAFGPSVLARTYSTRAFEGGVWFDARTSKIADLVAGLSARPGAAIVMLGQTNIDACAKDPEGTAEVNVRGVIRVIRDLSELGIMPVFLSSDGIFDGSRAYWSEADEPRPILTYGRQKVEVERFVATLPGPWLIARLPKLLSTQPDPRCMLTQWIGALETGGRIICATDQFFTPAAATDAAQALAALVRGGAQGLYHLGGPERLSRRELLQAVLDEYGKSSVPKAEIAYCSLREIRVREPRPLDTSLSSERFASRYANPMRAASEVARLIVRNHCAP